MNAATHPTYSQPQPQPHIQSQTQTPTHSNTQAGMPTSSLNTLAPPLPLPGQERIDLGVVIKQLKATSLSHPLTHALYSYRHFLSLLFLSHFCPLRTSLEGAAREVISLLRCAEAFLVGKTHTHGNGGRLQITPGEK